MVRAMPEQDLPAARARLAAIDRDLARLRYRHDVAMSAFRFEEATALGPAIAALEKEREHLAAALPKVEPPTGTVPILARPVGAERRGTPSRIPPRLRRRSAPRQ
jgi:hypothetical protein